MVELEPGTNVAKGALWKSEGKKSRLVYSEVEIGSLTTIRTCLRKSYATQAAPCTKVGSAAACTFAQGPPIRDPAAGRRLGPLSAALRI